MTAVTPTLPLCVGNLTCAPCYLGAHSSTLAFPYALTTIVVEVIPLLWNFGGTSTSTNYTTITSTATVEPPGFNSSGNATSTLPVYSVPTFTDPNDLTWVTDGATLTYGTEYVSYDDFYGQAPTGGRPICGVSTNISQISLPATVASSSFILPVVTNSPYPTGKNGIPLQILTSLAAIPPINGQFGNGALSRCFSANPSVPTCYYPTTSTSVTCMYSTVTYDGSSTSLSSTCLTAYLTTTATYPLLPTLTSTGLESSFSTASHSTASLLTTTTGAAQLFNVPGLVNSIPAQSPASPISPSPEPVQTPTTPQTQPQASPSSPHTTPPQQSPPASTTPPPEQQTPPSTSPDANPDRPPPGSSSPPASPAGPFPSSCTDAACIFSSAGGVNTQSDGNPGHTPQQPTAGGPNSASDGGSPPQQSPSGGPNSGSRGGSPPQQSPSDIPNSGSTDGSSSQHSTAGGPANSLPGVTSNTPFPTAVVTGPGGPNTISKISSGVFGLPHTTISQGQTATLSGGQAVGVNSQGSLVISGSTVTFNQSPLSRTATPTAVIPGPLGSKTVSQITSGVYGFPQTTISQGQIATLPDGQTIGVDPDGSLVVDGSTVSMNESPAPSALPGATPVSTAIISGPEGSKTISKISSGVYAFPHTTIIEGQTVTLRDGQVAGVNSDGSLVVDGSTVPITTSPLPTDSAFFTFGRGQTLTPGGTVTIGPSTTVSLDENGNLVYVNGVPETITSDVFTIGGNSYTAMILTATSTGLGGYVWSGLIPEESSSIPIATQTGNSTGNMTGVIPFTGRSSDQLTPLASCLGLFLTTIVLITWA